MKPKKNASSAYVVIEVYDKPPSDVFPIASVKLLDDNYQAALRKNVVASVKCTADGEAVPERARHNYGNGFPATQPQKVRFETFIQRT